MGVLPQFAIGNLVTELPIMQGGMGVGISLSTLAGSVAGHGGIGLISAAQIGFREPDFEKRPLEANLRAIPKELKRAGEIERLCQGALKKERKSDAKIRSAVGFNIMVASHRYGEYVKTAVACGADLIVSGAGLPLELADYLEEGMKLREHLADEEIRGSRKNRPKMVPIISSAKSARVILRMWDRKQNTTADAVVMEGPLAGGHLGFSLEELAYYGADTPEPSRTFRWDRLDEEVKRVLEVVNEYGMRYNKRIPLVLAGGIYTHEDILHALSLGAAGVQIGTRFVTTYECDAPAHYKEAYIRAGEGDIKITKSPVGLPGRAIDNAFLHRIKESRPEIKKCYACLTKCDRDTIPYCITDALLTAANGDTDNALLFAGSNAWRATKLESVYDVMRSLAGETE